MAERVYLAANNPDLGGGERMVIRHAETLLALGHEVAVVAPDAPTEVLDAADGVGATPIAIRADGRRDHLARLRAWDRRERDGLLWCHGLVPSLATAGHGDRIVHLHQDPHGPAQQAAWSLARRRARAVLVPSHDMSRRIRGSRAHPNWTEQIELAPGHPATSAVGYLGRLSLDKGVDVLCRAVAGLPGVRLVLAGDARYVPDDSRHAAHLAIEALGDRALRLGHTPPAEVFVRCDLLAFPSRWAEPFGLVVAEAMAAGVPFVISDAGALPEVAGPGHPWTARSGDAADLAAQIARALAAPEAEVRAVTAEARRRWEEHYSPQAGRLRVQQLLADLGVA
jgi:glycosyltransferase involved in cell wall biosynthesis